KCYWPGVTRADVEQVAARAGRAGLAAGSNPVTYPGSLLFAGDDLVLCLLQGPSRAAVIQASDRLGIPCARLMGSVGSALAGCGGRRRGGGCSLILVRACSGLGVAIFTGTAQAVVAWRPTR